MLATRRVRSEKGDLDGAPRGAHTGMACVRGTLVWRGKNRRFLSVVRPCFFFGGFWSLGVSSSGIRSVVVATLAVEHGASAGGLLGWPLIPATTGAQDGRFAPANPVRAYLICPVYAAFVQSAFDFNAFN